MLCGNFIDGGRRLFGGKYLGDLVPFLNKRMQVIAQVVHRTSRYTLLGANVLLEAVIRAVLLATVAEYSLELV
jgi:hypothetical protein